jgi:hypothetical protein
MAKDEDLPRRIEAVFARTGLGNLDPEKLVEYLDQYDRLMAGADRLRNSKTPQDFDEVLAVAPPAEPEDE